jgi:hypothetical protein
MKIRQMVAVGLTFTVAAMAMPTGLVAASGQQNAAISGTARKEAKKPYTDFSARARNVQDGQIAGTVLLDQDANFSLPGLPLATYVVELLNHDNKVVCTEGPFNLTQQPVKNDVNISCNKVPAAWWLLGAAAAAGITAGVVTANSSPSR